MVGFHSTQFIVAKKTVITERVELPCVIMGKDIDLMQAVRDEDLSVLQKLLDRSRGQRSSK